MPVNKILLLPGMDGTGKLLLDFSHALPKQMRRVIPIYLADRFLSYADLAGLVRSFCEDSEPFVLMAESFSTPLAIQVAAERPKNLKALILCAGFAESPVRGPARWLGWVLAPVLMRIPLLDSTIRSRLAGEDATEELMAAGRKAIASVQPHVLAGRLRAALTCDVRSTLERINVPILYLQAQHDRLVGSRCFAQIRRLRPDIQTRVIDGPHFLLQRYLEEAARIVTEFIGSL
jgi:pimeloyl-ACP methyl ester carboxylesterase